jgi:hypothetical protein
MLYRNIDEFISGNIRSFEIEKKRRRHDLSENDILYVWKVGLALILFQHINPMLTIRPRNIIR